jgi:zinc protease
MRELKRTLVRRMVSVINSNMRFPVRRRQGQMRQWTVATLFGLTPIGLLFHLYGNPFERPSSQRATQPVSHVVDSSWVDPALTVGTLPNGMRYYIRVNKSPAKRAELWLAVNAGSLQEDDDQQGFAHFLEHMAFNGTRNFPQNTLIDFIETAGMTFGGDLNAFTSFDETVYQLTIPTDSVAFLRNGLQVLEDWASGGITIDSGEVLAERGVVLGEWRSRMVDTASENFFRHQQATLYGKDSRYVKRFPIGDPELLQNAQPEPLRRFYRDWYRPDLMAVIAVGDFDKAEMEREIKERFGKIPPVENPRPRITSSARAGTEPIVDIFRGRVIPGVSVLWKGESQPEDPQSAFQQALIRQLLLRDLQHTFLELRKQERRPFFQATLNQISLSRAIRGTYVLSIVATPDSLQTGLAAALTELERIAQHGIPQPILEQHKAALLRRLESAAAAEAAVVSKPLAAHYAEHYLTGEGLLMGSQQQLTLARAILPTITSSTLAQAAQFWRDSTRRTILYTAHQFVHVTPPTAASLTALFDSIASHPVEARSVPADQAPLSLLSKAPSAGRVTSERRHKASGITEWTLSNGARVFYKETSFNPDEFLLYAHSLGGTSRLPDSLAFSPGRLVGMMMTAAGGLGNADREQLMKQLTTTTLTEFEVALNYTDESIRMAGSPKDLETLFQLMYLQFTAPKLDTAAVAVWKRYGYQTLTQSANDQIANMLASGNRRLMPPSFALVDLVNVEQAMRVYRDRFGDAGDFTFTLVGAAPAARVKPLVEQYIASLPSLNKKEREQPIDPKLRPWSGIFRSTERVQPVPKTTSILVFDGRFPETPDDNLRERQRLLTVTHVLNRRLRNELRERLGGTYGVAVVPQFYAKPQEHYRLTINFDAAPERADTLIDVLLQQLDSVRAFGATAQELSTISTILRRGMETQLQNNRYWARTIQHFDRLGIPLDRIVKPYTDQLSPQDIAAAMRTYLPTSSFIHLTYTPRDTTKNKPKETAEQRSGNDGDGKLTSPSTHPPLTQIHRPHGNSRGH